MYQKWKLRKPQLVITITGRRKNFTLSKQMKKAFQQGLIEATKSVDSWILTNGANVGVSKMVGEAINKNLSNNRTKLIGILNWNTVAFRDDIEVIFFNTFNSK